MFGEWVAQGDSSRLEQQVVPHPGGRLRGLGAAGVHEERLHGPGELLTGAALLLAEVRHLLPQAGELLRHLLEVGVLKRLHHQKPGQLPRAGIEVQVLDHGFAERYEKSSKKRPDWFTTHGDVFPVGKARMKPFPPTSPNGSRSFPRKNLSKGVGEWNHYYIRAINGEVRLWVNGEEVSGGNNAEPNSGYVCLESEGSPIDFRNLAVRELP